MVGNNFKRRDFLKLSSAFACALSIPTSYILASNEASRYTHIVKFSLPSKMTLDDFLKSRSLWLNVAQIELLEKKLLAEHKLLNIKIVSEENFISYVYTWSSLDSYHYFSEQYFKHLDHEKRTALGIRRQILSKADKEYIIVNNKLHKV